TEIQQHYEAGSASHTSLYQSPRIDLTAGTKVKTATVTKSLTVPGGTEIASSDTGLVGLWHMNEGTGTSVADSAGTNTGTWAGTGTHWETTNPKLGAGAGKFNGSDDYVGVPDSDAWNFTASDGTIDFWFKVNSMPSIAGGLINQVNNDNHWTIYYYSDGKIGVGTSGVNEITSASGVISTGVWYHVAVVKSGSTTTIYVAGNQVASATTAVWTSSPNPLRIGGHSHWNVDYNHTGLIDEVAIYNRALTGEEIKDHYLRGVADLRTYARSGSTSTINSEVIPASGTDVDTTQEDFDAGTKTNCYATEYNDLRAQNEISSSESGLVGLWHMNNNWLDAKGTNNGTRYGTGTPFETASPKLGAASGKFNGSNDYVGLTTQISKADTAVYSLELWYKGTDTATNGSLGKTLLGRDSNDIHANLVLRGGYIEFLHHYGGWLHNIKSTTLVADGSWHHIVYTNYSNQTGDLYIDGNKEINGQSSSIDNDSYPFRIDYLMRGYSAAHTSGLIDEVAIYNRALSATEIQQHYEAGSPATASVFVSEAVDLGSGGAVKAETVKLTADIPSGATLKIYAGSSATEGGSYSWDTGSELFSTVGDNQTLTHTVAASANRWWKYKIEGTTNGTSSWVVYDAMLSSKAGYRDSSQAEFDAGTVDANTIVGADDGTGAMYVPYGVVGLWHMNNDWLDASPSGNNGIAYNGATFTTAAKLGSHAGSFDGGNDYVETSSTSFPTGTGARSLELWFKAAN
ncbi:MAG: LamG domain-containing protein, partial [Candidatus Omnitrophica bacterium]|nr:LamG domain-containing protein [Candidatus Omnitrophota bacterium]